MQITAPRSVFGTVILEVRALCFLVQRLNHRTGLKPDVYFKPQEVWEIRGAE